VVLLLLVYGVTTMVHVHSQDEELHIIIMVCMQGREMGKEEDGYLGKMDCLYGWNGLFQAYT
jgi:hypothetical protein